MEHTCFAHTDAELAALKADAAHHIQGDQLDLCLDLTADAPTSSAAVTSAVG